VAEGGASSHGREGPPGNEVGQTLTLTALGTVLAGSCHFPTTTSDFWQRGRRSERLLRAFSPVITPFRAVVSGRESLLDPHEPDCGALLASEKEDENLSPEAMGDRSWGGCPRSRPGTGQVKAGAHRGEVTC
jgi:hypothetical protein